MIARLSFDLGDTDAKLEEVKAKIASLSANEKVRITYDTRGSRSGNPLTDLEKIAREASRINNKAVMSLRLADGTRTWEQLIAIDREMARLNGKTARMHVKVDKGGFFNDIKAMFSNLGGALGGGHSFNLPFVNMTANPIGLAAITAGIAALLPELAGLVAGFSAAGAGAAAFYVLAHPAIKNLETDITNLSGARTKLQTAQNAYAIDPSKLNLKALQKAQDQLKAIKMSMSQDAGGAAGNLIRLQAEYSKLTTAFKPEAFKVFNSGLKLAADLLPHLTPFANTFADSLSKIFSNLDKSSKSKGFQDFLKSFHGIEGPALQAIGAGIGNVAGSIGRLLTVMSGKDVAHTINIAFSAISGTIGGLTATIRFLMQAWDGMFLAAHNVASAFDGIRHGVAGIGHAVAHEFDTIRHTIAGFSPAAIISKFASLGGKIKGALAGAGGWLVSTGSAAITGLWKGAISAWSGVVAWFGGIPGKVKGFFAGAGAWLVSVGANIIQGLINGLNSKLGALSGIVAKIAGIVKSVAGFLGIHSPSTVMFQYGLNVAQGLAMGMVSGMSQVQQAAGMLASAAMGGGSGWVTSAGPGLAGSHGAAFHGGTGGGEIVVHSHIHLDGREIYSGIQRQAAITQRRTGTAGFTRRTR